MLKVLRLTCHGHFPEEALWPPTTCVHSVPGLGSGDVASRAVRGPGALPGASTASHTQFPRAQGEPAASRGCSAPAPPESAQAWGRGAGPRTVGALDGARTHPGTRARSPPSEAGSGTAARASAGLAGGQGWVSKAGDPGSVIGGLDRNPALTIAVALRSALCLWAAPSPIYPLSPGSGRGVSPPKSAQQHLSQDLHQAPGNAHGGGGGVDTEWGVSRGAQCCGRCPGWARPPMLRKGLSPQEPPQNSQGVAWAPAQGFTVHALPGRWGRCIGRCLLQWAWHGAPGSHPPGRAPGPAEWEAEAAKGETGPLGARACRRDWAGTAASRPLPASFRGTGSPWALEEKAPWLPQQSGPGAPAPGLVRSLRWRRSTSASPSQRGSKEGTVGRAR